MGWMRKKRRSPDWMDGWFGSTGLESRTRVERVRRSGSGEQEGGDTAV
jgi:hypothetical protein